MILVAGSRSQRPPEQPLTIGWFFLLHPQIEATPLTTEATMFIRTQHMIRCQCDRVKVPF